MLWEDPTLRYCVLGRDAGIVDLCPCVHLTVRGVADVISQMEERNRHSSKGREEDFSHSCSTTLGEFELDVNFEGALSEAGDLIVYTENTLFFPTSGTTLSLSVCSALRGLYLAFCPHLQFMSVVDHYLDLSLNSRQRVSSHLSCDICDTIVTGLRVVRRKGGFQYTVMSVRSLGDGKQRDDGSWSEQISEVYPKIHDSKL